MNPFAIMTPEQMKPEMARQLYVEMRSDFPFIKRPGNSIISGARGCGKSMFIRCCLPDVLMQGEDANIEFEELEDLSFCVSCKTTYPRITEFDWLEKQHFAYKINEHFLSLHVLMSALLQLTKITIKKYIKEEYELFFENTYSRYMKLCKCYDEITPNYSDPKKFFRSLYMHTEKLQGELLDYTDQFTLNTESEDYSYNLPLLSFYRFIRPVFSELVQLSGFPKNKNIIIYIDDADNLSWIQTRIINKWISYRTQPSISLKITTQIGLYKTFLTSDNMLIESPHDYKSINISNKYTTNTLDQYYDKAIEILQKRLETAGINVSPEEFFPPNTAQEAAIEQLINTTDGDVDRKSAVANYISLLPQNTTYQYAGIKNIIHLSSGIIRFLLDAASDMYDEQCTIDQTQDVVKIDPGVQDRILRAQADTFLYSELKKMNNSDELHPVPQPFNNIGKLQNLIVSMGKTFHDILVNSNRVTRNFFAIRISSSTLDESVKSVLDLGIRLGFFHEFRSASMDGIGRTQLYILNRCLSPLFTLDPTSSWLPLPVTNQALLSAMNTAKLLRNVSDEENNDQVQLMLFDFDNEENWDEY